MRILFVCVHNAGRSQMAEAYVNQLAREGGLAIVAESAGTMGGKELNPQAVAAMAEDGVSLEGHRPKLLTQEMVDRADRVITMGCGVDAAACPARFMVTEDWGLDDPAGQPMEKVREIRDQIKARVQGALTPLRGPLPGGEETHVEGALTPLRGPLPGGEETHGEEK
ncbi:MAG TPA: arsenate reductase ArsC [Fimbriimonadaceae bacterium]|nr:arsenate reductase ArsC [Fimbriimonadaceae bacterium]